jgi:hypothetical protein
VLDIAQINSLIREHWGIPLEAENQSAREIVDGSCIPAIRSLRVDIRGVELNL